MKIFYSAITVFLLVSPILSFYIHDTNSKVGYVSVQHSARSSERHGLRAMQRKHFSGSSRIQKNENIVDSHFKVPKNPPYFAYNNVENRRNEVQQMHQNTEAPINQQLKLEKETVKETSRQQESVYSGLRGRSIDRQEMQQPFTMQVHRSRPINAEYHVQLPQHNQNVPLRNYQDHQNRYEKPKFVEMNVHKTQISTDPQKMVRLNNNQQITTLSVNGPNDKKIPTAVIVDKTLQKVSAHNDRHSQVMSRVLDEMTHKISDRRYKGENRKRDIEYNANYDMDKTNRNSISDTMKKYIIGKDKTINVERKSMKEFPRIGNHEDSIEPEDNPYAIFYRMHPDALDEQEGFISKSSMEDNTNLFTNKKKRLSIGYERELDLKKAKNKSKNSNAAVKLHNYVKHLSNFRSL